MPLHGTAKHRPNVAEELCQALVPRLDNLELLPWLEAQSPSGVGDHFQTKWQYPTGDDGSAQGVRYCSARGEILRPLQDDRQRRRSASACSSIKNESVGSEDDQTPS